MGVTLAAPSLASAEPALPPGFQDEVVFSGLELPTAVRFAPNGMVFVAEKAGKIKVFENLEDDTPELFKDLRTETYDHGDRGLLGLAIDPDFPAQPYVYALFTYDHIIGDPTPPPKWGMADRTGDSCPLVPANGADDCVVSGRLVRYTADVSVDGGGHLHAIASGEKALIPEDWCQQFSSHSIGDLHFGPEGALYASGGDGASFTSADFGQLGTPPNPCGDPDEEGGSLRSQDLRTPETAGDPTGLNGTVIRIDPETGAGWPTNPLAGSSSSNERRIIALGFRNPFRFTIDPQSNEIYSGSVGSSEFEEIDRFDPASGSLYNSGWPCYEGADPQFQFKNLGLAICDEMYDEPNAASPPLFYYSHRQAVMPGDECSYSSGSAISGLSFYEGEEFPAAYRGALFFSDSVRGCFYVMFPGADGHPDPNQIQPFLAGGSVYPGVDIQEGPDGFLYYTSLLDGGITGGVHRITYAPGAPQARLSADQRWGPIPLEVRFDASASTDPDRDTLQYEWDLDGDGAFETSGGATQSRMFTQAELDRAIADGENGNVVVSVRVGDGRYSSVAKLTIYPGDTPPVPTIREPLESYLWRVGDTIHLSGSAKNQEGRSLEPLFMYWSTSILHCPTGPLDCHAHPLQVFPGVLSADLVAPEHDYPSYIEITLSASDRRGLSATKTIRLTARSVNVTIASEPPGIPLTAGLVARNAPFDVLSIEGAQLVIAAPETAELNGQTYTWQRWSDGGSRVHTIVADGPSQYVASFAAPVKPVAEPSGPTEEEPPAAPPNTSIGRHPPKSTRSAGAKFAFRASAAGANFRCKLDRQKLKPCRSPVTYRRLKPGPHVFKVMAVDAGGAADPTPAKFTWKVLPKR